MLPCPKPMTWKSKNYLKHVRAYPCIVCGCIHTQAHHVKTVGSGGSDTFAVPLCVFCHREIHVIGRDTFQKKYNINIYQELFMVARSWIEVGNL